MENKAGNYLKLALSYNGKFVLYFYDNKYLFKKIIPRLQQAYEDITLFFETNTIGEGFKKEYTVFRHPAIHFKTGSFTYICQKQFFKNLDWQTILLLLMWVSVNTYGIVQLYPKIDFTSGLAIILISLFVFPLLGGMNLLLSIRYYQVFKKTKIILSRGAGQFQYGTNDQMETIDKSAIADITILRNNSTRCPWDHYCITRIGLFDNMELDIPSILIDYYTIFHKFPSIQIKEAFDIVPFPRTKPVN